MSTMREGVMATRSRGSSGEKDEDEAAAADEDDDDMEAEEVEAMPPTRDSRQPSLFWLLITICLVPNITTARFFQACVHRNWAVISSSLALTRGKPRGRGT